jgi:hypothetical protein
VSALVLAQVDHVDRSTNPREERLYDFVRGPNEGVDGAVMIGVGVDVEQARRARHRLA